MQPKLSPLTGKNLIATCPSDSHSKSPTRQSTGRCAIKPRSAGDFHVSPITRSMRAPTCSSAPPCSKGFQAFLASSACAASATSYPSCSSAPLPWPSAFRGLRPCPRQGAPFWPSGLTLRSSGRLRRRLPCSLALKKWHLAPLHYWYSG